MGQADLLALCVHVQPWLRDVSARRGSDLSVSTVGASGCSCRIDCSVWSYTMGQRLGEPATFEAFGTGANYVTLHCSSLTSPRTPFLCHLACKMPMALRRLASSCPAQNQRCLGISFLSFLVSATASHCFLCHAHSNTTTTHLQPQEPLKGRV